MQAFTIKEIERMSGIKAHTLRMWEKRYELVLPHRKQSQHRWYSNEDLKSILRVAWLYHQGYRISHIASLSDTEKAALIDKQIQSGHYFSEATAQLMKASLDVDTERFQLLLQQIILPLGLESATVQVLYPFLEKLGLLWMNDELMPAQEHLASLHIRHAIIRSIDELPQPTAKHPPIVLFMPEEEYHEMPLLFVHFMLKKNGYGVLYFGGNHAEDAVESYCQRHATGLMHYHYITNFTRFDSQEYLQNWCRRFPQWRIVVSGGGVQQLGAVPANAHVLKSMLQLQLHCRQPFSEQA